MNYYNEIKNKLIEEEIYSKTKDFSKEKHKVITYFEIGRLLAEAGKHYGESIITHYSEKLVMDVGKKYHDRTLYRMRKFYNVFNNEKLSPLVSKLTWSHYLQLLSIKDEDEIIYYITQTINRNLGKRQLQTIIKNQEYERLPSDTKNKLSHKERIKIQDFIPNPILVKKKDYHTEMITEKVLHQLILEDISNFMKELGSGYSFIDHEYKIKIGEQYHYIDLLLYNYEFNCFIVIELKVTELKKEHIGQIHVYMNYINYHLKKPFQDKTIGIIIVKKNNQFIMEYCSDSRILTRTYQFV